MMATRLTEIMWIFAEATDWNCLLLMAEQSSALSPVTLCKGLHSIMTFTQGCTEKPLLS